jgi:hypothetical protein
MINSTNACQMSLRQMRPPIRSESLKHEQESHMLHMLRAQNCKAKAGKVDALPHGKGSASPRCCGLYKLAVIGQSLQLAELQ